MSAVARSAGPASAEESNSNVGWAVAAFAAPFVLTGIDKARREGRGAIDGAVEGAADAAEGASDLILLGFGVLIYWGIITMPFQLLWPGEEPDALWWTLFLGHIVALVTWLGWPDDSPPPASVPHRFYEQVLINGSTACRITGCAAGWGDPIHAPTHAHLDVRAADRSFC